MFQGKNPLWFRSQRVLKHKGRIFRFYLRKPLFLHRIMLTCGQHKQFYFNIIKDRAGVATCYRASKPIHELRHGLRTSFKALGLILTIKPISFVVKLTLRASIPKPSLDTPRHKVNKNAKMQYRRSFLEKWLKKQWVEQYERGKYKLTEYGRVVVEVF